VVSLLKGWFGDNATPENGFCYDKLPKVEPGVDYASMFMFDKMYAGKMKGGMIFGHNPCMSMPNTHKIRAAMQKLDWLVMGEVHDTETSSFWRQPGLDPKKIKTEVFLLPSCQRGEKDGTTSNSGRWHQWHHKGYEPMGQSKSMGWMMVEIIQARAGPLRQGEGRVPRGHPVPCLAQGVRRRGNGQRINGRFTADVTIKDKTYKKGDQVPSFPSLQADGTTTSLNWLYCGWLSRSGQEPGQAPRSDPDAHAGQARSVPQLLLGLAREPAHHLQPRLR
jgi:formate dehydrogenase major subunit